MKERNMIDQRPNIVLIITEPPGGSSKNRIHNPFSWKSVFRGRILPMIQSPAMSNPIMSYSDGESAAT